jgi:hypothetical protein
MINKAYHSSTMNLPIIGVLNDTEALLVGTIQGKRGLHSILLPPNVSELEGVLEVLWQARVTSVWVMPGTTLSRIATCAWFEQAGLHWVVVTHPDPHEPTRPLSVLLWPKGSSQWEAHRLLFVFPEHAGWNWALPDAKSLLATVTYVEQVLARPVIDASALVAHQLLTELTPDQPTSWLRSSPVDVSTLHSGSGTAIPMVDAARDLVWMRSLTLVEQRQRYLHKYTHLSRDLQACMAVQLGAGVPEYSSNGRAYDGIRPGIWRIRTELAGSVFDGKRLPSCVDGEWMSTPQVKCCQDIGYYVDVQEGYYWSQSHEVLKQWAKTLWQAAERLYLRPQSYRHVQGKANAFQTIKQLAQLGVAILAKDQNEGGWARPDWWAQVVGRSRAVLFSHLANLARKGTMPVLVDRDALWVVSDDPNPLSAAPGLVAPHRWQGYRVGYEVPLPLSREVKAVFKEGEHPDRASMTLDTLAGEGVL